MTAPALNPPKRILMGPGPSDIHPRVLEAIGKDTVGHLDPFFLETMNEMQNMLRALMKTENPLTFAVSATGSAGMETAIVNSVEPGDNMLVCINGVFGNRMTDVAERAGANVSNIEKPWGEVFSVDDIVQGIEQSNPAVVGIVMAETSTGAFQPIKEIAQAVRDAGALLLVDAVTSLGGMNVEVDNWGIDILYSGSQKCLSCPPGLAPVSFGPRAVEKLNNRKEKVRSWYLDATMLASYWGEERVYHHTAPINMTYALYEALRVIHEEGLENCFKRHLDTHRALKAGLETLGIDYNADPNHQLPMLNAVKIPEGIDDSAVRSALLNEFGIEIGGGLGAFKGKVWRIGLMGYAARKENVVLFLSALEELLKRHNYQLEPGAAVDAANSIFQT